MFQFGYFLYVEQSRPPELDKIDIRQPKHTIQKRRLMNVFQVLLEFLDFTYEPHTTEWMSDYAKITMIGNLSELIGNLSELHIGGDGSVEIIESNRLEGLDGTAVMIESTVRVESTPGR